MNINDSSNDGPRRSERVAKRNARKEAREKAKCKARDEEIERIVRVLFTEDLAHLVRNSRLSFAKRNNRHHLMKALAGEVQNLRRTKMTGLSYIFGPYVPPPRNRQSI